MKENYEMNLDRSLKRLVKTSMIVFFGLILSKLFTYVYRIYIARSFGPEQYGLFSFGLVVLGWFVTFSSLGLADGVLRYVAMYRAKNNHEGIKKTIKLCLYCSIISSLVASVILFFSSEFIAVNFLHNSQLIIYLKAFSILIPIIILGNIYANIIRAHEKIAVYSFIINLA